MSNILQSITPFEEYNCYFHRNRNSCRNVVMLYSRKNPKDIIGITFAKYLMCIHLKRWLNPEEIVHHINEVQTDDRIENLQIVTAKEHRKLHASGRCFVKLECPICHKIFERAKRDTRFSDKQKKVTTCSYACAYKVQSFCKKNSITTRELGQQQQIIEEYYK